MALQNTWTKNNDVNTVYKPWEIRTLPISQASSLSFILYPYLHNLLYHHYTLHATCYFSYRYNHPFFGTLVYWFSSFLKLFVYRAVFLKLFTSIAYPFVFIWINFTQFLGFHWDFNSTGKKIWSCTFGIKYFPTKAKLSIPSKHWSHYIEIAACYI